MGRDILLPQQHEGHAVASELLMHAAVLGQQVVRVKVQSACTKLQRRSLSVRMVGPSRPATFATPTYLPTTSSEMLNEAAVRSWERGAEVRND